MGIYQRENIWWYKFKKDGKPYYESSESTAPGEAERLLRIAQGDVARGKTPMVIFNQVTFDELAEDFLADFKIQKRQEESLANASINRELSALKRMFSLAAEADPPKIDRVPKIPMLTEDNVRKGFFEPNEYQALYKELPDYLKPVLAFAYFSGWRVSEILSLKWDRVGLEQRKAWIPPGETKNKESREIYLDEDLLGKLKVLRVKRNPLCPYVFQRDGERIKRFTKAWETACREAGLWVFDEKKDRMAPTKIFHDLRRTAVKENVRAGVPTGVAMKISGHKTMSVFERYNITDDKDLRQAAEKSHLFIQTQGGRGDNRGDNQGISGEISPSIYRDKELNSLNKAPVAQVDRARDS